MTSASTTLRDIHPVRLRAAAAASPADLAGSAAEVDAARAHELIHGPGWRESLAARGREVDFVAREHGVARRAWCRGTDVTPLTLATEAARAALERAEWSAAQVELLALATSTPWSATKCLAAQVAAALGVTCGAVDVRGGGAGGLDGWIHASLAVAAGVKAALVVAVETPSLWFDAQSGTSALLFGDGAAALALDRGAGRLAYAAQGSAAVPGLAFTVPGELPPRPDGAYAFRGPDAEYRAALAEISASAAARLAREVRATDTFLPYGVRREQIDALTREVGLDSAYISAHLARRGALGAAGPLVAAAERLADATLPRPTALVSLAVGGGARWTILRHDLGGLT